MTARRSGFPASAERARDSNAASSGTTAPLTSVGPRAGRMIERTTCTSSPCAACGRSRGTAGVTMIFAVTTKITSRTNITSTSGVTLMPAMMPPLPLLLLEATLHLSQGWSFSRTARLIGDVREHEVREHLGARQERSDPALQIVV